MVSLHYEITKEDYVHFYMHMLWDAKGRKKKRVKAFIRQAAYNLAFCAVLFYIGSSRFDKFTLLFIALLLCISFLPLISAKTDAERQAATIAEDPDNGNIFTEYALIATDADLYIKTSFHETRTFWKGFLKKTETATHFFLFENALQAILIPKRAFNTTEDLAEFQKILSRNLSLQAELKDDNIDG